jgi:hypothetical protein
MDFTFTPIFDLNGRAHAFPKLHRAASLAESILNNPEFHAEIVKESHFSYTDHTPFKVLHKIRVEIEAKNGRRNELVSVDTYRPAWPWSAAIAKTVKGRISLNERKIPSMSELEYVGTLVHEFMHVIGYGHGNNSPKGKEQSVPYRVGKLAYLFAKRKYEDSEG